MALGYFVSQEILRRTVATINNHLILGTIPSRTRELVFYAVIRLVKLVGVKWHFELFELPFDNQILTFFVVS